MTAEWIFIEILINSVEVGVLYHLLCNKFPAKYRICVPTLCFILGDIIFLSLPMFISFGELPLIEILFPISCFLYLLYFRNGKVSKKIFWIVFSFVILASIASFSILIISFTSGIHISYIMHINLNSTERLLAMIIAKTLQVIIFYILGKRTEKSEIKNILSFLPMLMCYTIPLISLILMIFIHILIQKNLYIPEELIFSISIGYLIINIIVFILYELINREAGKNYMLMAQNKQYELTEQHNNQVIEIYDKMRDWRHEYKHHMQLVMGMLEQIDAEKNNGAINYIKDLDKKLKRSSLEIVTGNYIVDAIVSAKATLASSYDITFEHNINLTKNIISVEDADLCSILSNLLDNAIEACCKLELNRYIALEMLIFKNQLNIRVTNSANGEYIIDKGKLKTTKRGDLHGIGMGHVRSIVENYNGIYDIKPETNSFTANISIPLENESI